MDVPRGPIPEVSLLDGLGDDSVILASIIALPPDWSGPVEGVPRWTQQHANDVDSQEWLLGFGARLNAWARKQRVTRGDLQADGGERVRKADDRVRPGGVGPGLFPGVAGSGRKRGKR